MLILLVRYGHIVSAIVNKAFVVVTLVHHIMLSNFAGNGLVSLKNALHLGIWKGRLSEVEKTAVTPNV